MLSFKTSKKEEREKGFVLQIPPVSGNIYGRFRLYDRSNNSLIIIIVYYIEIWRGELCSHTQDFGQTNKKRKGSRRAIFKQTVKTVKTERKRNFQSTQRAAILLEFLFFKKGKAMANAD